MKKLLIFLGLLLLVGTASAVVTQFNFTDGTDNWSIFNGTGSATWDVPGGVSVADILVVAGAGAGGAGNGGGGGGGAGGVAYQTSRSVTGSISLTVGSGGIATPYDAQPHDGNRGINSTFDNITAIGGGGGASQTGSVNATRHGGSGGGGNYNGQNAGGNGTQTNSGGATGYGNNGGANTASSGQYGGGGGGGAGGTGAEGNATKGGNGGTGISNSIDGIATFYAGGGGGGGNTGSAGTGGSSCGGNGGGGSVGYNSTAGTYGCGGGGGGGGCVRAGYGGNGVVIIRYAIPGVVTNDPIPSFTSDVISGVAPLSVQFNDTSVTTPTAWNWSYTNVTPGNNTQIWWSTTKNATQTFGIGNWDIRLNVTNASGYATTATPYWINVTPTSLTANFTGTPLIGTPGTVVAFTDNTTGNGISAWTYNWSFGDGVVNTTANPSHTYSSVGNYDVNLTVYNSSVGYSTKLRSGYVTISSSGNLSGWNRQDIMMDQIYSLTLRIKDSSSHNGIPSAVIQLSNGDNTTTDLFGVATFSMNYSAIVVQVGATGYYSRTISYVVDRDRDETIYLTAVAASTNVTPQTMTYYTPWQVRIRIADFYGNPLPGTNVTANYIASTLPSTNISWLITAYGVQAATAEQMTDSGVAMTGVTDDNGGLSFSMFKSIQYALAITNTTAGISATKNLYPSDQEYLIRVPIAGQQAVNNTLSAMASTSLPVYQLNATAYNLSVIYRDTSGLTDKVLFIVKYRNGTVLNSEDLGNPGTGTVVGNYTVNNIGIGTEILWSYNARRAGT